MNAFTDDNDDHATWGKTLEYFFIEKLYDEAQKGIQASTLDKKTWMKIENEIRTKFKKQFTVVQLKTKWNRFRRKTREFQNLIETTGFGWNSEANTVTADEDVWQSYLMQNPSAKTYKKKGLAHFFLLREIFCGTIATGHMVIGPQTAANVPRVESTHSVDVDAEEEGTGDSNKVKKDLNRCRLAKGNNSRLKKKSKNAMESEMELLAKFVSLRSEASVQRTNDLQQYLAAKRARMGDRRESDVSIEDLTSIEICIELLDKMENLDDRTYGMSIKKLSEDKDFRRSFVKIKPERRHSFILNLME